jgi:hypothetical protein
VCSETIPTAVITATGVRSTPALMTTSVAKAAAIPMTDTLARMFMKFCHSRKYGEAIER